PASCAGAAGPAAPGTAGARWALGARGASGTHRDHSAAWESSPVLTSGGRRAAGSTEGSVVVSPRPTEACAASRLSKAWAFVTTRDGSLTRSAGTSNTKAPYTGIPGERTWPLKVSGNQPRSK